MKVQISPDGITALVEGPDDVSDLALFLQTWQRMKVGIEKQPTITEKFTGVTPEMEQK